MRSHLTARHRPGRLAVMVLAALATLLLTVSPLSPHTARAYAASTAKKTPSTITIAAPGAVDSLNPFVAVDAVPTEIQRLQYGFLTTYAPKDFSPLGQLATSWTPSPDGLTWTYKIRSNARWSDGVPVTAHDIAWTYNLIMTNPAAQTANGSFVANFQSVTAPDNTTLVIKLKQPQATMLALDIPIVPEHVWRDHVSDIGTYSDADHFPIVSDGPYVITSYKVDQYIELTANPRFWGGAPKFQHIVFRYYKDTDAAVEALRKGEVSFVTNLTPTQYDSLKKAKNVTLNNAPGVRFYSLTMNPGATTLSGQHFGNGNPALANIDVRRAIMYAIDKPELVSKVLGGFGQVGEGYIPPIFSQYTWKPSGSQAITYNPAKANQLLDAAGYKRGPNGMRETPDGKPFTLRLIGENDRAFDADTQNAVFIQEWLKAVGINVQPSIISSNQAATEEQSGDYDLAFDSWIVNPDPDYVLAMQTCGTRPTSATTTGETDDFICDPAYDRLYAQQERQGADPAARTATIKQMEQQLYQDSYINVLYYPGQPEAYRSDVIGSIEKQPQPNGLIWGQDGYWSWWSATPATSGSSGGSTGAIAGIVIGVVVVVVIVGGVIMARRRRATAEERE